jgi:asparagine synthase (glutamine-hydrolysing)
MCGIAGLYGKGPVDRALLLNMAGELRHRGPDGTGVYIDQGFGMINTRLAIVDLDGGDQPLSCERGRYWAMQNGEIYNYVELRSELRALGHHFATSSDTEVIAHAYEEWGTDCLRRLNGDFAIAVWDRARAELFLARDRFGVRPLFIAQLGDDICFASEAKALLRHPRARRELDPVGIVDTFTLWGTLPDHSAIAGVRELPAAHYLIVDRDGRVTEKRWWDIDFSSQSGPEEDLLEELEALLDDSIRLRLRADVPVATYLSGGLDSSLIAAIAAQQRASAGLFAFGVGFEDATFDESAEQDTIARRLGTNFHRTTVDSSAIAEALPRVVRLAEKPLLRTAPAPLLELSGAVRSAGLKVVLTGEGADELFAGYDIFREDAVRRFWARDPGSPLRPLLLTRLNRFLAVDPARAGAFLSRFYARDLLATDDPLYSHRLRFLNTERCLRLLSGELTDQVAGHPTPAERLETQLPSRFGSFSPLGRAQYVEIATFLEGYLLHAQGDRMLMGNAIEGRFPFLDFRLAEFAARLPDSMRLGRLREKRALREVAKRHLPAQISSRTKVPYRAPIRSAFFSAKRPAYIGELLDRARVQDAGLLEATAVGRVVTKFERSGGVSETDEMALVGCVSLMLLHEQLIANPDLAAPAQPTRVVVGDQIETNQFLEPMQEAA